MTEAAIERLRNFVDGRVCDILKVAAPNGLAMAVLHSLDARTVIDLVVGGVTVAYTIWRWRRDARKRD